MKRSTFLKSLAGAAIAPIVISQIPEKEPSDAEKMLEGAKEIDNLLEENVNDVVMGPKFIEELLEKIIIKDDTGTCYLKTV